MNLDISGASRNLGYLKVIIVYDICDPVFKQFTFTRLEANWKHPVQISIINIVRDSWNWLTTCIAKCVGRDWKRPQDFLTVRESTYGTASNSIRPLTTFNGVYQPRKGVAFVTLWLRPHKGVRQSVDMTAQHIARTKFHSHFVAYLKDQQRVLS